ncbi:conjugal transfer protein TraD [Legionella geestiana]|nr:conjugal transfer protein TraD [Legionella geestiana]
MQRYTAIAEKYDDLKTLGFIAEFSPEEAELAGAFQEEALSAEEALESTPDGLDAGEVP